MAVAVVSGDELVYEAGFGYADVKARRLVTPETLFYIASTSKSFTAFAAALLHDESRLDLDAPLSGYLPTLVMKPPLSADEITLRDLLTHTHGIQQGGPLEFRTAFTGEFTNDQLIQLLGTYDPSPNGRVFRYGNLGYNVVGLAMESALRKGWKEVLQSEVFGPLGMTKTTAYRSQADPSSLAMPYRMGPDGVTPLHYATDDSNMHAAGGHLTTVGDLAKYLEAHLNAGRVDGKQVFASAVVAETHRQHTEQDRNYGPLHRHGWGLGWDLGSYDGDTVIHRFGGIQRVSFPPFVHARAPDWHRHAGERVGRFTASQCSGSGDLRSNAREAKPGRWDRATIGAGSESGRPSSGADAPRPPAPSGATANAASPSRGLCRHLPQCRLREHGVESGRRQTQCRDGAGSEYDGSV